MNKNVDETKRHHQLKSKWVLMSMITSCLKESPKQSIQRCALQRIFMKGLDKYHKKCVDEKFDVSISQRGKGRVVSYEDCNVMTNGT